MESYIMRKLYLNSSLIKQAVAITVQYACFIQTIVFQKKRSVNLGHSQLKAHLHIYEIWWYNMHVSWLYLMERIDAYAI